MFQYTSIFVQGAVATDETAGQVAAAARRLLQETAMNQRELAINANVPYAALTAFLQRPTAGIVAGHYSTIDKEVDKYLERKAKDLAAGRLNDFVETPVSDELSTLVDYVIGQDEAKIGVFRCDTGTGKTTALLAKRREVPWCVYYSVSTATRTLKGMLEDIMQATGQSYGRVDSERQARVLAVGALRGCNLLIVDEFHQLILRKRDDCIQMLAELNRDHKVPQLWVGTMDIARYIDQRANKWGNLLSQIRRLVCKTCDMDTLKSADGSLFRRNHIARLLGGGKRRLDDEAMRYMVAVANISQEGGIGLVKNLYAMAVVIAEAAHSPVITRDMLKAAHAHIGGGMTRTLVEARLAQETPAATAKRMVG